MKFYDASRPLYPKTDASGASFGVGLLQERDGMNYGHDHVQNNATVCPITFISKSLLNT